MALSVHGRMKVRRLKEEFKKTFGVSIRVYKGVQFADDDATLASIRRSGAPLAGDFSVHGNTLVGNVERQFLETLGIKVRIESPDGGLADQGKRLGRLRALHRGEQADLTKDRPGMTRLLIGLGWDVNRSGGAAFDLNACAFLLGADGKCPSEREVIFYNNLEHPSGAVKHLGDDQTGDLDKVPAAIGRIVFAVTIHEAGERKQNFGQVKNAFLRVADEAASEELLCFELGEDFSTETSVIAAELRRAGKGFQGGLEALCRQYGVDAG